MAKIPVIILAYANNPDSRLEYLVEEIIAVEKSLRVLLGQFEVIPIYNATITKIRNEVSEYGDRVVSFMYSGHAGGSQIETVNDPMSAIGLANALSECLMLKLVLINGCSSIGHEAELSSKQIPLILLTEAPINDKAASKFSAFFWKAISDGRTVSEAFKEGKGKAQDYRTSSIREITGTEDQIRSLDTEKRRSGNPWILKANTPEDMNWSLDTAVEDFKYINEFETNKYLTKTLYDVFVVKDFQKISMADFNSARQFIYSHLPIFITEHIKKLVLKPTSKEDYSLYFIEPNLRRIEKIIDFYLALKKLVKSLTLAEIREQLIHNSVFELSQNINDFLTQNQEQSNTEINTILRGIDFLKGKIIFITELVNIDRQIWQTTDKFFTDTKKRIDKTKNSDISNSEKLNLKHQRQLCEDSEIFISNFLRQLFFLKEYKFVTIKSITVNKNRFKLIPEYRFILWNYDHNADATDPGSSNEIPVKYPPDNASILIIKSKNKQNNQAKNITEIVKDLEKDYLNLSPFLIDDNALIFDKAKITKISFCDIASPDEYIYKSFERPSDTVFTKIASTDENNKQFYINLKEQFEHFGELISKLSSNGPTS